jgi:hypothetical protein
MEPKEPAGIRAQLLQEAMAADLARTRPQQKTVFGALD